MAQGDIIQKDLGLVTAYGYALAGGYQGTEEQFKIDFANLMAGKYSGSELHEYSTQSSSETVLAEEPFSPWSESVDIVFSDLLTYGNVSFVSVSAKLLEEVTVNANGFLGLALFNYENSKKEIFQRYNPMQIKSKYNQGTWGRSASCLSGFTFSDGTSSNPSNIVRRFEADYWFDYGHSFIGVAMTNISGREITIQADNTFVITAMFMNHIGQSQIS